jgi:hypothetical protein
MSPRCASLLFISTIAIGCSGKSTIDCAINADCLQGGIGGTCRPSPSTEESWCSFPDPGCTGTRERWGVASGDGLAGECVVGVVQEDGGVPDGGPADASVPTDFAFRFGGVTDETIRKTIQASDGTLFVIVPFSGTVTIDGRTFTSAGEGDFLLAHLTASGGIQWMERIGGAGNDSPTDLAVTPDGAVVVLGTFSETTDLGGGPLTASGYEDFFLLKVDSAGVFVWARRYGAFDQESATGLAVNAAGDLFVSGHFTGSTTIGDGISLVSAGYNDIFMVRYSGTDGSVQWSERIGDAGNEHAATISTLGPNVAISGSLDGTINLGHGQVSVPGGAAFLASYSAATGIYNWSRIIAQQSPISPIGTTGMSLLSDGSIAACGIAYGDTDFGSGMVSGGNGTSFVVRYAANGSLSWLRTFPVTDHPLDCKALAVDAMDRILIGGVLFRAVDFGNDVLTPTQPGADVFVARYSKDNAPLGAEAFSSASQETIISLTAKPQLVVTGSFSGSVRVEDSEDLASAGGVDSFVIGRVLP